MTINSLGAPAVAPVNLTSPVLAEAAPVQAEQNRALSQAVRVVNSSSPRDQDRQLSLFLDPTTRMAIAKVVDSTTGRVLDQVPSEDILRLAAYLEAQTAKENSAQQAASKNIPVVR